jgi:hypothetical protein
MALKDGSDASSEPQTILASYSLFTIITVVFIHATSDMALTCERRGMAKEMPLSSIAKYRKGQREGLGTLHCFYLNHRCC